MFTGLVETMGTVEEMLNQPPGKMLIIHAPDVAAGAGIGDSIAINGCCLTVVAAEAHRLSFQAGEETLGRTNLGRLAVGSQVNLERSLRVGDRLGGHFVSGHVDAVGQLEQRVDDADWSRFWFTMPQPLGRQMASKASITVDGVSLTLVDVQTERFSVALIPHTLQATTLGRLQPGDLVNLETDILAKYVQQQLAYRDASQLPLD